MLLVTLLGVGWILQGSELDRLEGHGVLFWLQSNNNYLAGSPASGKIGVMEHVPDDFRASLKHFQPAEGEPVDYPKDLYEALNEIERDLQERVLQLSVSLGGGTMEQPQSALMATNLVLGVLENNTDRWRVAVHSVDATYQPGRQGKPDSVKVETDLVFYGNDVLDATTKYEDFRSEIKDQIWMVSVDQKRSDELDSGKGIYIQRLPIIVDVSAYEKSIQETQVEGQER